MAQGRLMCCIPYKHGQEHDASLRVLNIYDHKHDAVITRIDVKAAGQQFNMAFYSSMPVEAQSGDQVLSNDALLTPASLDMVGCLNVRAAKQDIVDALTQLVVDLKNNVG